LSARKSQFWVVLIVAVILLPLTVVGGLWVYTLATVRLLHPDPRTVPTAADSPPAPAWSAAVEQARQAVRAALTEDNLPGLSVAVGTGGNIVWAEGFGWADLDNQVKVEPDTRFRIGTASTVLTSAAVGLLLEQQRLKLDENIQTYVPEFPGKQWPVTVRQLMGHVAGVRNDSGDEGPLFGVHCERPVEGLQGFAGDALLFEPGTQFRYSSFGWILLSAAVESAAGEPFLTFMRKQVFEPLAMNDTRAESATEPIPRRATFYFPRFAAEPRYGPDVMRPLDYSCYAGSSVFLSTPSDLVRFAMAINSGKLLKPETVRLLQTSQRLPSGQETGYGLGWDLETVTIAGKETVVLGHDGDSLGGRAASLMTFPDHGIVVAVISNISYAHTDTLGVKIAEAFVQRDPARK